MALVNIGAASSIGFDSLWIIHTLKLLIEVIEETIGIDKMRDHCSALTMMLDAMIDHGYFHVNEKSVFVSLIQQPSSAALALINKVMAAGSVIDRHSNALHAAVMNQGKGAIPYWRWNEVANDLASGGVLLNAEQLGSGIIKDVYVDFDEYASCVVNETGDILCSTIIGEVIVDTKLPNSSHSLMPKVTLKLRLGMETSHITAHP